MATILEMKNISKSFPGVLALDNVNLKLERGEVKALVGENGAGKSTLIKILTGAYTPDSGEIKVFGQTFHRMTPILSERLGISAVYQNLILAGHLTVLENVLMGIEPSFLGFLKKREMEKRVEEILERIGYKGIISLHQRVKDLSAAQQGMVAIARALSRSAKIFIFDEPTAVLAEKEVKELFRVIRQLKSEGMSVIYISHRLEEIFELCDNVLVLKDGKVVGERSVKETTEDELIRMMVGREIRKDLYDPYRKIGEVILKVEELKNEKLKGCSFEVRKGEIVGIYGLVGSGRTELARALFGADPIESGRIYLNGTEVKIKNPRRAIKVGLGLVPEDRREQGLALKLSVKVNINLPIYERMGRIGFIKLSEERKTAEHYVKVLAIKTPHINQIVANLSGGNQQKVVLAKWLASQSRIFIMDEPTNGIDVGAKQEIYDLINKLAREGAGIIFISSYMPELMAVCDRILVMRDGKIVTSLNREEFDEEKILSFAIKSNVLATEQGGMER